jgi:hypothetical protein
MSRASDVIRIAHLYDCQIHGDIISDLSPEAQCEQDVFVCCPHCETPATYIDEVLVSVILSSKAIAGSLAVSIRRANDDNSDSK